MTDVADPRTHRVVLADDEQLVIDALSDLINDAHAFEVVGAGSSGEDAAALVAHHDASAAIVDVDMPTGGKDAIRLIHALRPFVPVIIFTASRSRSLHRSLIEAGAEAVVTKGSDDDILAVLRSAV